MTLGKLLNLSRFQFPHLLNEGTAFPAETGDNNVKSLAFYVVTVQ